jgi:hypothetical protein
VIVRAVIEWFIGIGEFVAGLIGAIEWDVGSSVLAAITTGFSYVADALAVVDPILPAAALAGAFAMVVGTTIVLWFVWLVRVIVSLFSGGGGNA